MVTIQIQDLDKRQQAMLWDAIDPFNFHSALLFTKGYITTAEWAEYWGDPCEAYTDRGCVCCDRWKLWSDLSGEPIKYASHEDDCLCPTCVSLSECSGDTLTKVIVDLYFEFDDISDAEVYSHLIMLMADHKLLWRKAERVSEEINDE